ncbi:MAG: hypothetical protein HC878_04790 [Leptolyngbyaceae cyanobacterium SL_5_14]|nr:hypothetical protein [Leptolyngbyaceae cyanobacterium SL_5_14]
MVASQRPKGVTFLAWLAIIGGIGNFLYGIYLLLPTDGGSLVSEGFGQLILCVLNIIFGIGALALKPWAWGYGMGVQVLSIIGHLINLGTLPGFYTGESIFGIAFNILIAYYLLRPNVKRVFGKA